jgi:hypothetical protein
MKDAVSILTAARWAPELSYLCCGLQLFLKFEEKFVDKPLHISGQCDDCCANSSLHTALGVASKIQRWWIAGMLRLQQNA